MNKECPECGSAKKEFFCHACAVWVCSEECFRDHNRREHRAK